MGGRFLWWEARTNEEEIWDEEIVSSLFGGRLIHLSWVNALSRWQQSFSLSSTIQAACGQWPGLSLAHQQISGASDSAWHFCQIIQPAKYADVQVSERQVEKKARRWKWVWPQWLLPEFGNRKKLRKKKKRDLLILEYMPSVEFLFKFKKIKT